ncbi:MAG TPA: DUF2007 domain-containing protein [Allosphingosinicella sp.]
MALIELERLTNSFEAGMARARLAAEGVDSFLFDFNVGTEGPGFLAIRLMVDEEDLEEARRILAAEGDG